MNVQEQQSQESSGNPFKKDNSSDIFQDKKPLNPNIDPDSKYFVCREDKKQEIAGHLQDLIDFGVSKNLMISGDTGVGKTISTKITLKFLDDVMEEQNYQTVYMTDMENERNTLRKISKQLDLDYLGPALEEYYDRLEQKLIEEDIMAVVVLDEVDKLFENERGGKNHGNSLSKQLLEVANTVNSADQGYLVLMAISNNTRQNEDFNAKVRSRFGDEVVNFPPYNAMELRQILNVRAEDAFKDQAIDAGVISKCSALIAQKDGDARKAIQLLMKAGEIAEDEDAQMIEKDHIDEAEEVLETNRIMQMIKMLPKQAHLIMYSAIMIRDKDEVVTGDLYSAYAKWAKHLDVNDLTQRRVRSILAKLDNMGLIRTETRSKGRAGGRTREITIDYDPEMIEEITNFVEEKYYIEEGDIEWWEQKKEAMGINR